MVRTMLAEYDIFNQFLNKNILHFYKFLCLRFDRLNAMKVRKPAKIRNRYNQVPHLTQDITWESDKNTIKHHKQESQEVSPFPEGDHKAAIDRCESMTNTRHK